MQKITCIKQNCVIIMVASIVVTVLLFNISYLFCITLSISHVYMIYLSYFFAWIIHDVFGIKTI
jgi:hypothetical protein